MTESLVDERTVSSVDSELPTLTLQIPSSKNNPYLWKVNNGPNGLIYIIGGVILCLIALVIVIWLFIDKHKSQKKTRKSFRSFNEKFKESLECPKLFNQKKNSIFAISLFGTQHPDDSAKDLFDEDELQNRRNPLITSPTLEMQIQQQKYIKEFNSRNASAFVE